MKRFPVLVALTLVVVACSDDAAVFTTSTSPPATAAQTSTTAPTPPPSSTSLPGSSTTPAPTTTAPPATTTTSPPATTVAGSPFTSATYGFFPDPLGTPADGHGSGCIHEPGALTDGMWFGFIDAIGGGTITFDMGCFFTGPAAVAAATADGEEAFDFYIRNQNPLTYNVPLDPTGTAYWRDITGDLTPLAIAMPDWPQPHPPSHQVCPDVSCAAWLYVNGGEVTELIEQYLP